MFYLNVLPYKTPIKKDMKRIKERGLCFAHAHHGALDPFFPRIARRELAVTSLRHGGSCPAAVRPLVCPAFAEAFLLFPGGSSRCPGRSHAPTSLLRRRQQTDAVARTEPGEPSRNIEKSWPSIGYRDLDVFQKCPAYVAGRKVTIARDAAFLPPLKAFRCFALFDFYV